MKPIAVSAGAGAAVMALVMTMATPQIQTWEGRENQAYRDIVNVLTVCDGHTGRDIVVGKVYSDSECDALTKSDAQIAAYGVLAVSPQLLYHPMQLASAVSFSYNVGTGTYAKSSVARNFNSGNFIAGCNALLKYTFAGGKYVQGLANRRVEEHRLCVSTLTVEGMRDVGITPSESS